MILYYVICRLLVSTCFVDKNDISFFSKYLHTILSFCIKVFEKGLCDNGGKVLSIILYSDTTICDILGKSSEHPIYLTLGNISNWRRNKPDAKAVIGYLPKIKATTESEKTK